MAPASINARCIAELVERLKKRSFPPPLVPKETADPEIQRILDSTSLESLFEGVKVRSEDFARAVQSGLYLWNDCLDASHRVAQKIETETGSYWHAIMHRREPDYTNSKHWWRKVGEHSLFPQVRVSALQVLSEVRGTWAAGARRTLEGGSWKPIDFVDWCEASAAGKLAEAGPLLEQIQLEEIKLLLAYSYQHAVA